MRSGDWSKLRHLFAIEPTVASWNQLLELLQNGAFESVELAVDYSLNRIHHWSEKQRLHTFLLLSDPRVFLLPPYSRFLGYTNTHVYFDGGHSTKAEDILFYFSDGQFRYEWILDRIYRDNDECYDAEHGTFSVVDEKSLLLTPNHYEVSRSIPSQDSFWPVLEKREKPYLFFFEETRQGFLLPSSFSVLPLPHSSLHWESFEDYYCANLDEDTTYEFAPLSSSLFFDYVAEVEHSRKQRK